MASIPVEALMIDKNANEAEYTPDSPHDYEFDKRDKHAASILLGGEYSSTNK
jgi:hypothetical protein